MRGENLIRWTGLRGVLGTPPHAWGKPCAIPHSNIVGYTPTCVGKTSKAGTMPVKKKVHPHMRGENLSRSGIDHLPLGTPPHAWGKQLNSQLNAAPTRYTHMRGENENG